MKKNRSLLKPIVVGLLTLCSPLQAADLSEIEERVRVQQQAIQQGKAALGDVQKAISDAARLESEMQRKQKRSSQKIKQLNKKIKQAQIEEQNSRNAARMLRSGARQTAVPVLAAGEAGLLKILFGRASYEDIVLADLVLANWLQTASTKVGKYVQTAQKANQAQKEIRVAMQQVQQQRQDYQRAVQGAQKSRDSREKLQQQLRGDLALRSRTLKSLREEAQRLKELLERQTSNDTDFDSLPTIRTAITTGRPKVLRSFGPYTDKATGLKLQSTGVVLYAGKGTPVFAAADGKVVFSDWFRGYGWMVILQHGGGFYSLYGHASELLVKQGDKATRGQKLALSGASGTLDGPSIYFEVRQGIKPINPLNWIASSN